MTKPQNYHTIRYGNKDGELKFGHITDNNETDAFIVRSGADPNHYIEMCSTGGPNRKNGTVCRSTGTFQVKAGDKVKSTSTPENYAIVFEAVDGDILLSAPNGRVKIDAQNIDLVGLRGFDGKNGTITLSANEKIILDSKGSIDIKGAVSVKLFSNDTVNIIGKAILNVYGGLIDFADGSSTTLAAGPKFGSKGGPHENEVRNVI
jgi:hypothetical protein